MNLVTELVSPTTTRTLFNFVAQKIGTSILDPTILYVDIGTTSSLSFEDLYTAKYTIDTNGVITLNDVYMFSSSFNDANGVSQIQISGDGGNTFVPMTDETPSGQLDRVGPGLWITNIQTGNDQFQIKVVGKSTDGLDATIRLDIISYVYIVFNKKII